jgi:hypothetical protein
MDRMTGFTRLTGSVLESGKILQSRAKSNGESWIEVQSSAFRLLFEDKLKLEL